MAARYLLVVADDYGIGPGTSRGILELASLGRVTGTVLLVNSPYAEEAVRDWRRSGVEADLGWHPCLNLDRPVLPPGRVGSLVDRDGQFLSLGAFMLRAFLGRIRADEVRAEFEAQLGRFHDLVGRPPAVVNCHKHVQVFSPVGAVLLELLRGLRPLPYLRRMYEPWRSLWRAPGARAKRLFLCALGRRLARAQARAGLPGNDVLAGVTNPDCVADPSFLVRWVEAVPGRVVELACHPGQHDPTLVGRDCPARELKRRTRELELLRGPEFLEACRPHPDAAVRAGPARRGGGRAGGLRGKGGAET